MGKNLAAILIEWALERPVVAVADKVGLDAAEPYSQELPMKARWLVGLAIVAAVLFCSGPRAEAVSGEPPASRPGGGDPRVADLAREVHDKGWIVYGARSPKGDWDLFLMRPDGTDVRNITNTPNANEAAPRFSPDGKRLLYRRLAGGTTISHDSFGFQGRLVIANADGTDPVAIGKDGEYPWASWGPDGKQIACLTRKGIQIVDLSTRKEIRQMPRNGIYQQLFWSPDGKWFCGVANHQDEMWTVVRMNVATGEMNPVNTFQNCTPDWFPDSKRIIFSYRPGNQDGYGFTQLWMADGDGNNRQLVFGQDGKHIYGGATSPDSKYALFTIGAEDGAGAEKDGAPIGIMRMTGAPTIAGESKALRKIHPKTKDEPVLVLQSGWEPHWTYADVAARK